MIYEITDKMTQIDPSALRADVLTVGLVTLAELKAAPGRYGVCEADILACEQKNRNVRGRLSAYDDYSFGLIAVLDTSDVEAAEDRIGILLRKNLFLMVDVLDDDRSTVRLFEAVMKKYRPENISIGRLAYAFFDAIMEGDLDVLDAAELEIDKMEEEVVNGTAGTRFNNRIFLMRRNMLELRNYYEQLISIGHELEADENDLFGDGDIRYFGLITDKATRLMNTVQLLRESLAQVRETFSAAMDNRMNQTMRLLTVITVIFMPLTLLVGWYGMNFRYMPELDWRFGYLAVIIASVLIAAFCIWFFKRKKFFD